MPGTLIVRLFVRLLPLLLGLSGVFAQNAARAEAMRITVALPGPGNLPYLPVELAKHIGADAAEGVDLQLRFFGGGPLAVKDMTDGNSDFAVLGLSALADLARKGQPLKSIAALCRSPGYVLMARADLRGKIRTVADLRGRVIGVHGSSRSGKSLSKQMAEYLLMRAGVAPEAVNFISAGQSLEAEQAALRAGAVDALLGNEPLASRLRAEGLVYYLADLYDEATATRLLGGPFLYTQVSTTQALLRQQPDKARRMAAVMRRTLRWMARHEPREVAQFLEARDPTAAREVARLLAEHPGLFSADGAFSRAETVTAERMFQAVFSDDPSARAFRFDSLIDASHLGWKD